MRRPGVNDGHSKKVPPSEALRLLRLILGRGRQMEGSEAAQSWRDGGGYDRRRIDRANRSVEKRLASAEAAKEERSKPWPRIEEVRRSSSHPPRVNKVIRSTPW